MEKLKLYIHTPGSNTALKLKGQNIVANQEYNIPFRYTKAEIENTEDLTKNGKLRHDNSRGALNGMGIQLPRTEKLIMLAKATQATKLTIGGKQYTLTADSLNEIDLFDFGAMITQEGEVTLSADKNCEIIFIARF